MYLYILKVAALVKYFNEAFHCALHCNENFLDLIEKTYP